jgi:hypothetical protein
VKFAEQLRALADALERARGGEDVGVDPDVMEIASRAIHPKSRYYVVKGPKGNLSWGAGCIYPDWTLT